LRFIRIQFRFGAGEIVVRQLDTNIVDDAAERTRAQHENSKRENKKTAEKCHPLMMNKIPRTDKPERILGSGSSHFGRGCHAFAQRSPDPTDDGSENEIRAGDLCEVHPAYKVREERI